MISTFSNHQTTVMSKITSGTINVFFIKFSFKALYVRKSKKFDVVLVHFITT